MDNFKLAISPTQLLCCLLFCFSQACYVEEKEDNLEDTVSKGDGSGGQLRIGCLSF